MRYQIPIDTEMTPDLLSEYIKQHKSDVLKRNQKLQDAYENKYEIFTKPKKDDNKPDHRVAVNFAKYIVDTFNGFFCGIPIKVSATNDNEDLARYVEYLDQYNDQDNGNAELAKLMDIHGEAHEMYYVDEEGQIGIAYQSPLTSFFLTDESILERPLYFIRYYKDSEGVERGSWSNSVYVQHFWLDGETYKWEDEPRRHGFDGVPAVEFLENDERMGIFESVLDDINEYNEALSEKANDIAYFADAYLKVIGPEVNDAEMSSMRRTRVIHFKGDIEQMPDIEFLGKPDADTSQEHHLDRLERLIFQISMVANISDENFGSATGVALKYKLQAMNNLFRFKANRFKAGLSKRYRLIFSNPVIKGSGVKTDDWLNLDYQLTPNYPLDVADEATTASTLEGIVSKETQLKAIPALVDDPRAEIEKMESESNQGKSMNVFQEDGEDEHENEHEEAQIEDE